MGLVVRRHARPGDPRTTVRRHPARGVGAAHPAEAHHDPRAPTTRGTRRRRNGCKQPRTHKQGGMGTCPRSSGCPSPPALSCTPPTCSKPRRYTHGDATQPQSDGTPQEDGAAWLAVAHFKTGGPLYDDALSRLDDTPGPLLLMLPTDLGAALHQELDSCDRLQVGWEAVADGNLLALLHRDTADECQWGMLAPDLTGRHVYMATPPQGQPRPGWDDLIAAFHDHGILPDDTWRGVRQKTFGRDYRRRVRAGLLEIQNPLCQSRDDLWLRRHGPWSPPSHLPHTCHLCGECDTVSSLAPTGANRCVQCSKVTACP